jgi:toxin FitB
VSFLLDTNVVSETRKRAPNPGVVAWLSGVSEGELFLSVLSLGELHRGVRLKSRTDEQAAAALAHWLNGIELLFAERLLSVDSAVCRHWAALTSMRTLPVIDSLLAATASVHELTIVTRNLKDFDGLGIAALNPWE